MSKKGAQNYKKVLNDVKEDRYGQMCLEKLIKFESYLSGLSFDVNYYGSGPESDDEESIASHRLDQTGYGSRTSVRLDRCGVMHTTENVRCLFFPSPPAMVEIANNTAQENGLNIQFSKILPFFTVDIDYPNDPDFKRPTEQQLDAFVTTIGSKLRQGLIDDLESFHEQTSGSRLTR